MSDLRTHFPRVISSFTDPDFRAAAFANYMESCAQNYTELISMCSEAASDDPYDEEEIPSLQDRVNSILESHSCSSNTVIALNDGYISLGDLLTNIINKSDNDALMDDQGDGIYDGVVSLFKKDLETESSTISVAEIADELQATLQSTVATAATAFASLSTEVGDRVSVFTSKMTNFFRDGYTYVSDTVTYCKDLLTNASATCSEICGSLINALQLDSLESNDISISSTNICQYTGASPVAALDFTTAKTIVGEAVQTVVSGVKTIVSGIWNGIVKPVFNWSKAKITQLFDNPYDLEILDGEALAHSIDGWQFQETRTFEWLSDFSWQTSTLSSYVTPVWGPQDDVMYQNICKNLLSYIGHWMKFKFMFGEVILKINEVKYHDGRSQSSTYYTLDETACESSDCKYYDFKPTIEILYKPYSINKDILEGCIVNAFSNSQYCKVNINPSVDLDLSITKASGVSASLTASEDFVSRIEQACTNAFNSGKLYNEINTDNEKEMYESFLNAWNIAQYFCTNIRDMIKAEHSAATGISSMTNMFALPKMKSKHATDVTNADWVMICSGWNQDTSNPEFSGAFGVLATHWFSMLIEQVIDRVIHPYDYIFLPYQNDQAGFDVPKFKIRTDDENQQALTTFLTTVTIVVIIAAVAFTGSRIIKKIQRKKYFKRAGFVGQMDSSMWEGGTLTAAQQRKYVRYTKKNNASSLFSSCLATSSSSTLLDTLSSSINAPQDNGVIALIKGY